MTGAVQLDRAVIFNDSDQVIKDVRIVHEPTDAMGEVSMILPHSEFELGLLQTRLKADKAVVHWTDARGHQRKGVVSMPAVAEKTQSMVLVYRFTAGGNVTAELHASEAEEVK